ncbi:MAG: hypothetical protein KC636_29470, partial [Myxococcales bacterium]|nr:hypothetical protein [Myxococcales bacterium]
MDLSLRECDDLRGRDADHGYSSAAREALAPLIDGRPCISVAARRNCTEPDARPLRGLTGQCRPQARAGASARDALVTA